MTRKDCAAIAGLTTLVVTILSLAVLQAGINYGEVREQRKAIEAGVGRWQVDAKTGKTFFQYGRE